MQLVEIKLVHQGQYLSYYEAEYKLPDGREKIYEFVSRSGSVHSKAAPLIVETLGKEMAPTAIVMFVVSEDGQRALLCKEFRLAANDWIYNNPAGLIEPGESYEEAARRELKEETGLDMTEVRYVWPTSYTMPGLTNDATQLIICAAKGEIQPSDSPMEQIESRWVTKAEAMELAANPEAHFSGRTQAMLTMWADS